MTRFAPLLLTALLATPPALADETPPPPAPDLGAGAQMLSEGAKLLLRGLLAQGAEGWDSLVDWLDDLSQYDPPERLPNGDILIRRRPPAEAEAPAPGATDL